MEENDSFFSRRRGGGGSVFCDLDSLRDEVAELVLESEEDRERDWRSASAKMS